MPTSPPSTQHLATLIRLLDDDTPMVRTSVVRELEVYEGDVSDWVDTLPHSLTTEESTMLGRLLRPARRRRLEMEWVVPTRGLQALSEDWERAESLLRLISDFLHDGVSVRQPLGDALDFLAEEAEPAFSKGGEGGMCAYLLSRHLQADRQSSLLPEQYDLAALAEGRKGNSLGLGAVLLLVAHRLGAQMRGVDFPGAFYLVIPESSQGHLTFDPAVGLRGIDPQVLTQRIMKASPAVREHLRAPFTPGDLLLRIIEDVEAAFAVHDQDEESHLFARMAESLQAS
ncbi:hypothetical protein HNR46_002227 [Haloferula luteola]|uniref:Protein SirB1 N-terminal domain-containing protein n=1 Tax=Haloferula luteola TaxID=595692 RepID=A0A840V4L4_9BACT|nr:transglutaminase family protein [Haloferula luteola]MBB5351986.1 hypothetical protein [Haloferula luteola]